jgi:hypothetical protein
MALNIPMLQWCIQKAKSSSDSSLTEKMNDLADFVQDAGMKKKKRKIDCDTLNDRISWLSSTFNDDTMANNIVALLTEYSQIHCSD